MRGLTLGIAALALAVPFAPAQALDPGSIRSAGGVRIHYGHGNGKWGGDRDRHRRDGDHRRHRDDRRGDVFLEGWGYDDWDGGRVWESDSYNDWWHDRPDRAFPRWVQSNAQTCERMWWNGSGWRC